MKRFVCLLLMLVLAFTAVTPAMADNDLFLQYDLDFPSLTMDVAVPQGNGNKFFGSVDGGSYQALNATPLDASNVGHIIVVDLNFTWLTKMTVEQGLTPILRTYLNNVDANSKVKFILANTSSQSMSTGYMSRDAAYNYIENSLVLPQQRAGLLSSTNIVSAISMAFGEAANYSGNTNEPRFKNVFLLVDCANTAIVSGLDGLGNSYANYQANGKAFPVIMAHVYAQTYHDDYTNDTRHPDQQAVIKQFGQGKGSYYTFASKCGTTPIQATHTYTATSEKVVTPDLSDRISRLPNYFTLDLFPMKSQVQGQRSVTLRFARDSRGSGAFEIENVTDLPEAAVTPTPTPTPTPSTPTPIPAKVVAGAPSSGDAAVMKVISKLQDLYYLDYDHERGISDRKAHETYDTECQQAYLRFCEANGLSSDNPNISNFAYNFLLSSDAKAAATPTPSPTPTATPTPAPTPTPVQPVYVGTKSQQAYTLLRLLQNKNYLDADANINSDNGWTREHLAAFKEFCDDNQIPYEMDMYNQQYISDELYNTIMSEESRSAFPTKEIITPEPSASPTPAPTVPAAGYALGDSEAEDTRFIQQMQAKLSGYGMFDAPYTGGTIDEATLDAVHQYCRASSISWDRESDVIPETIVNSILNNEGQVKRLEKTAAEKLKDFFLRDTLKLGNFTVQMWMLIAVVAVLILLLLILLICAPKHNNNSDPFSRPDLGTNGDRNSGTPSAPPAPLPNPNGSSPFSAQGGAGYAPDEDKTIPMGDGDATMPVTAGLNVTMNISGGPSSGTRSFMITHSDFVIGRKKNGLNLNLALEGDPSVSRPHAKLNYINKQLLITNLSKTNTTTVNNRPLPDSSAAPAETESTLPLSVMQGGSSGGGSSSGFMLHSGDTIEIGNYVIRVEW